ncbi:NAD-dependent epimerase/dehydratase family protein [Sphingomonas sp. HF-S4]|uniref:NAD-dependent epimerase/dehydratase family protein n=1 Tax=Sphingomonas agrestis TaxID=3080540 RepID=A0ABU3Y9A0_9SPHN|nr:NAD-dependent epimerase/dehydratase family protein [Sphingomonas sp. HF-S4]MDV3457847.1 NAD-dependent epimerase/dehydratase family protein [Sphingomonas sp. HF-S4]
MIFEADMAAVNAALAPLWPRLAGARIFMTGGTGFIGRWMLEALARSGIDAQVTLLSRDPDAFAARAPHLAARFDLVAGDVTRFLAPAGNYTHVLHAATDASAALNANDPRRMFDTIVDGTRRALDLAVENQARFVFLSSGAVYGAQPWEVSHVGEDWRGGPDPCDPLSAYGEGKRAAEMLCAIYARQFGLDVVNARIFALLGPLLSLDIHFAAGNFIRDAMAGKPIRIIGSGEAVRSYLYAADLTIWLWTLLIAGKPGTVVNMGSEEAVSIADLARRTAALLGGPGVEILGQPDPGWNAGRYVPSTARIRAELGVAPTVGLDDAILRTARANGWKP